MAEQQPTNNSSPIYGMLGSIGSGAVGGIMGIAQSLIGNAAAERMAAQAREENYKYNEKAAQNADIRTRALYKDFYSPEALLRQYTEAGLSPSLMFGGTPGQGGTAGAMSAGAAGPMPQTFGVNMIEGASIAKMLADADKAKAEAQNIKAKTPGEIKELDARIKLLVQETGNKELEASQLALQNIYQEFQNQVFAETAETSIKMMSEQLKLLGEEIKKARAEAKISEESAESIIQYNKEKVTNIMADSFLKYAQTSLAKENIKLTKAQTSSIIAHIFLDSANTEINRKEVEKKIEKMSSEIGLINQQQKVVISNHVLQWIEGIGGTAANILKGVALMGM